MPFRTREPGFPLLLVKNEVAELEVNTIGEVACLLDAGTKILGLGRELQVLCICQSRTLTKQHTYSSTQGPKDTALILRTLISINSLNRNAPTMGHPPRPPLRPLRHPPIRLHSRITSTCDPSLWSRPTYPSQHLPVLSCTTHHNIRWPQPCHWSGYAGVLLAGHVQSHGHDIDVLHGIWRRGYGRDELVGHGREGCGARCRVRDTGIDWLGFVGLGGHKADGRAADWYTRQVVYQLPAHESPTNQTRNRTDTRKSAELVL